MIYGQDNRVDTLESSNPLYRRLADSTAARILTRNLRGEGNNVFVSAGTMKEELNVCSSARFSHQQVAADCSGTLVAPNLIVTAGHCMMSASACEQYSWVFNYRVRNARLSAVTLRARDVYSCKKVTKFEMTDGRDFALVQLDRPVSNAVPVKVATSQPRVGTKVLTIGNPSGLPQKISDGAVVKSVSETEFKATLDTFNRGSGSPVFNAQSGELLGLLVRGETDYVKSREGCLVPNVLSESSPGEDVSSSIQFLKHLRR